MAVKRNRPSETSLKSLKALSQTEGTILNDCIDYEGYAEQLLEQQDFRCALDGEAYIKRNAQALVSDYVQPSPEMTM